MEVFNGETLGAFAFTCVACGCSIVAGVVAHLLAGVAPRLRLVSRHRRDRFSSRRVPLTGGVGLMAGVLAAFLAVPPEPVSRAVIGSLVAVAGFFVVGTLDDVFELRPPLKFSLQGAVAIAASVLLASSAGQLGLVLLLLMLLVNASNYLDNMDGLLSGVAFAQALCLLFFSTSASLGATTLVWALPGVLLLTLPPARVFLGDSGSHLVGALLAVDAAHLLLGPDGVRARFVVPLLLVFAVPLVDVATVSTSRLRRGRPLFRGGTDHLSHRLVRAGFPVPRAVAVLVLASAVCGISALLLLHS